MQQELRSNRSNPIRLITIAALLLGLGACGSTTLEQTWTSTAARQQPPLQNVVTMFLSENETIRRTGEDQMARDLAKKGVRATPSYAVLHEELKELDATTKSRLATLGYDGVVTMRVVERYQELEYMPGIYDSYWYGYPGFYSGGYGYTQTVSRVETKAVSLKTGQVLWLGLTRTVADDPHTVIDDTSKIIAEQITDNGIGV